MFQNYRYHLFLLCREPFLSQSRGHTHLGQYILCLSLACYPISLKWTKKAASKLEKCGNNYKMAFWRGVSKKEVAILSHHLSKDRGCQGHQPWLPPQISLRNLTHKVQCKSNGPSCPCAKCILPSHMAKKELENLEECIDGSGLEMTYITSIHIPMARIKSNYKWGWEMWRSREPFGDPCDRQSKGQSLITQFSCLRMKRGYS